tara:strand:- start:912 stop:2540 length:1629 start_codon:yes stop_codon:yes gene_type:complete
VEKYVVSARKYRPTKFEEVVGQEHVTTTLKNAIKNNKVAQSLLFCGPRGVGKTTCARILANEINEFTIENPIESSNSLNIYELDAASNNSVDDIRNLIDQVRYAPQSGKYKVYIIDEVHMLSNAAFNAFLKTLEEPPSYAIFILATTEKNKVIPTILSRCQIYDFNRIEINDIKNKLIEILTTENIDFEESALHLISKKADGAMRDALSTLDLIKTFSKTSKITVEDVTKNLNIIDNELFFKMTDYFFNSDETNTLLLHNEIIQRGFESINLLSGLSNHFRNLLLSKNDDLIKIMEVSDDDKLKFKNHSETINTNFIKKGLEILNSFEINYKLSSNPKIHTEIALLKICSINKKKTEVGIQENPKKKISEKSKVEKNAKIELKVKKDEKKIIEKDTPNLKNLISSEPVQIKERKEIKYESNNGDKIDFNEESFKSKIKIFMEKIKEKKSEIAILEKEIKFEGKNIIFQLDNELEGSIFDDLKNKLQFFLKETFKENIEVNKEVKIQEKSRTIYTNKDKYEYLSKKNKSLIDLKNKLGLDYEF